MRDYQFKAFPIQAGLALLFLTSLIMAVSAQTRSSGDAGEAATVTEVEGRVDTQRVRSQAWDRAYTNQVLTAGDRLRTRERSRATLLWTDRSSLRLGQLTEIEIQPASGSATTAAPSTFNLLGGLLFFLHRDRPAQVRFNTRTASAAVRGTELVLSVEEDGRTVVTVIDGVVELSNALGGVTLTSGQRGEAELNKAPVRTPSLEIADVIQWCLYYPAVLDLADLELEPAVEQELSASLAAYREGDLLAALAQYPAERNPASPRERVYRAALLLAVGQVAEAAQLLPVPENQPSESDRSGRLAAALRELINTVKGQSAAGNAWAFPISLPTEAMAASYRRQASGDLAEAMRAARSATVNSPRFGFAWARLAELHFSFGEKEQALETLNRSLELSPRNAQSLALKGFLLAARGDTRSAIRWFDEALAVDGALGNAWLGRGLCRLRLGDSQGGQQDLLIAATVEPQRAILRSYLGKSYTEAGDRTRAQAEFERAQTLDPNDPTSWLYSALFHAQNREINRAVRDLEESQKRAENERIYRSRLLLDQDRAVRSANLARIYRDAGMVDLSVREASRAVNADYASYSSHLFLANSYDQLRDPRLVNLRLETAANTEYLIANLLAPVGGGMLNPAISQQEYSRLFERNRLGLVSSTEYFSRGDWVQSGAQFGVFDSTSYSIGAFYRSENGDRPNADVEQRQLLLQLKQQLTPQDSVYVEASHLEIEGGDLRQYYDNRSPFPEVRTLERQEPILTLGYHREWSPGHHTLLLASWVNDEFHYRNPAHPLLLFNLGPVVSSVVPEISADTRYRADVDLFSIEPQHIWQLERNTAIVGARFQTGDFDMKNLQGSPLGWENLFSDPAAAQRFDTDFERWSVYGYDQFRILEPLWLTGGLVYDRLTFPENFLAPPLSSHRSTEEQVSPKAGLIWTPSPKSTVRFAYTRSLAGASLDQSVRIEPTQVAGFNQALRSLIPESVTGSIPGAEFDTYGLSLEQKIGSSTYLGASGEILDSDADRTIGVFVANPPPLPPPPQPGQPPPPLNLIPARPENLRQRLDYVERSIQLTADQLLGENWAVGARYRLTQAELDTAFLGLPDNLVTGGFQLRQTLESILHQVTVVASFNHVSGLFSQAEAEWFSQSNHGYSPRRSGDDFWQLNLFAGYRFPHRRAELRVGLLNATDQDYRLDPLTFYSELRRERTFTARLRFNF